MGQFRFTLSIITIVFSACMSGQIRTASLSDETRSVYVKKVVLRQPDGDIQQSTCGIDDIKITFSRGTFSIKGEGINFNLTAVNLLSDFPKMYQGVTKSGMYYILYLHDYRDNLYIQLTPSPKGFMDEIIQPEILYIVSTKDICK